MTNCDISKLTSYSDNNFVLKEDVAKKAENKNKVIVITSTGYEGVVKGRNGSWDINVNIYNNDNSLFLSNTHTTSSDVYISTSCSDYTKIKNIIIDIDIVWNAVPEPGLMIYANCTNGDEVYFTYSSETGGTESNAYCKHPLNNAHPDGKCHCIERIEIRPNSMALGGSTWNCNLNFQFGDF